METALRQEAYAGVLCLLAVLVTAIVWPPAGLVFSVAVFFLARRAGWRTVSRICLVVAVALSAWALWALVEGVGVHGMTSAGESPAVPSE